MRKALIIGINDYKSAPLKCCVNDANVLGSILGTHGDGSPNFDVRQQNNIQTKSELKGLIAELFNGHAETTLFYFSGHGYLNELGGYIVTPDFKSYDEGASMSDILELANQSNAKDKIIILDCCHSGSIAAPTASGNLSPLKEGISILTASKSDESAIEVNGHGIFTNLLINALEGGAADLRGHISPGSIYSYVDQALGAWEQRPVFKTNVTRFTSLRTVVPQVPVEIIRSLTKLFPNPSDQINLDPSFEDTNSPDIDHKIVQPYAKPENTAIFKVLQKFQSVGLVVPVDESHMYFAAMNSKSCRLTALGHHYWRLVKDRRI